ncbi:MAG TPA: hypothetical protein VM077_02440 [Candidatus Limnocylindrales bacterium]|nr:hypothetical protein [Candidatus Limnocylindrales bacterium]
MILSKIKKHLGYYSAFIIVQILGLILVLMSAGNKQLQLVAILGTTIFYFLFSVVHHLLDHDLTKKIVLEYALMGCLGLAGALVAFKHI